jgi:hypothetical protein
MTIVIDPAFSVYRLVERTNAHSAVLRHRDTMIRISHEIENATIVEGARSRIFAGFQRFSRFLPQMARYQRLAQKAELVFVFGIPDVTLPPITNVTYVPLAPTDELAREWFLISYGRDYASALATQEIASSVQQRDEDRQFRGFLNYKPALASILNNWLTSAVDAPPVYLEPEQVNMQRLKDIQRRSISRFQSQIARLNDNESESRLHAELTDLLKHEMYA